ncbi:MAG TPA: hypothetical protein VGF86_13070 [Candidatus Tumulicola sp.]
MTDKDLYGKSLGEGFLKVRAALCAPDDETAIRIASDYIDAQMRKEIHVEDLLAQVTPAVGPQGYFFSIEELLARVEQLADSLAGEHFAAAARRACETRASHEALLDDLCARAVETTRRRLELQKDYKDDVAAQRAFARLEAEIKIALLAKVAGRCGFANATKPPTLVVKDQREILQFEVVTE